MGNKFCYLAFPIVLDEVYNSMVEFWSKNNGKIVEERISSDKSIKTLTIQRGMSFSSNGENYIIKFKFNQYVASTYVAIEVSLTLGNRVQWLIPKRIINQWVKQLNYIGSVNLVRNERIDDFFNFKEKEPVKIKPIPVRKIKPVEHQIEMPQVEFQVETETKGIQDDNIDINAKVITPPKPNESIEHLEKQTNFYTNYGAKVKESHKEIKYKQKKEYYKDTAWLKHQFHELGRSIQDIATEQGVSIITIRKWLDISEEEKQKLLEKPEIRVKDPLLNKGLTKYYQGKFDQAKKIFNAAINKDPTIAMGWQYNAMTLYELGMYEKACEQIKRAHELEPLSIEICFEFIKIHLKNGTYGELLHFCEENQNLDPEGFKYKFIEVHERFKQYTPALEIVNDLLSTQPEDSYLLRLKDFLMQAERNCNNYYIPIIQTGLLENIPIGEEIIYSSNMRIHWEINIIPYRERKFNSRFIDFFIEDIDIFDIMHIVELIMKDRSNKKEILTDVLMSPEKLFFMKKNPKEDLLQSIPWSDITIEKNGTLVVKFELNYHRYEVTFDFNYLLNSESESSFIARKQNFYDFIMAKRYQYTQECLEKIKECVKDFRDVEAQEWYNKGRGSNLWYSDYNLGNELADAFNPAKIRLSKLKEDVIDKAEDTILTYLNDNKGKAFTSKSLGNRMSEIAEDLGIMDYISENLDGILNKLVYSGKIELDTRGKTQFYFVVP